MTTPGNQVHRRRLRSHSRSHILSEFDDKKTDLITIEEITSHYEQVLLRLKQLVTDRSQKLPHRVDSERFRKLLDWVDYKPEYMRVLEQAWNDESFWPFLQTVEATKLVRDHPSHIVIRLSNTHPGTITVTRNGHVMLGDGSNRRYDVQVKHKRYFCVMTGKLLITGTNPQREVSWDGLIEYLHQDECCICLEQLHNKSDIDALNCGHYFHKTCLRTFFQFARHPNGGQYLCPLCREPIQSLETIIGNKALAYSSMPSDRDISIPAANSRRVSNSHSHSTMISVGAAAPRGHHNNHHHSQQHSHTMNHSISINTGNVPSAMSTIAPESHSQHRTSNGLFRNFHFKKHRHKT